jgi:hypothetical protein
MTKQPIKSAEELEVYRVAYRVAMEIYEEARLNSKFEIRNSKIIQNDQRPAFLLCHP